MWYSWWAAVAKFCRLDDYISMMLSASTVTSAFPDPDYAPQDGRMPSYALLDNIRSVWNVGSMFRTADAAGLGGLWLCGMTATPPRPDMEKTALGATLSVPWNYATDALTTAREVQKRGLAIVALEQTPNAQDWDHFTCPFPHVFVVGHEVRGVQSAILDLADQVVEIPMSGTKQSLNVAVSFGVLCYAIRRQWLARTAVRGTP